MNINRKYIIIFGALILLLVIIAGAITYYNERTVGLVKPPESEQNGYFSIPIPENKKYEIWWYEDEYKTWNNCAGRTLFWPKELISISVNLKQFDNIIYDPYFFCYDTDLEEVLGKQCFSRSASHVGGFVLENKTIPQDKEIFTLLKLTVYPNNNFEKAEGITIMDLTGKLIK